MLFRKTGFPEESELVICTVTKVNPNSVFVNLDEFDKSGLVHISEVSPGRIRNIRDYVKEGKVIVCKVLSVNQDKGHIDLSLRRVTESQRRMKVNEMKQEQKAEKIIEFIAKKQKKDFKSMFKEVAAKLMGSYDSVHEGFEDVVLGNASLEKLGIEAKTAKELETLIRQRITKPEVEIKGNFKLKSYEGNGVEIVKQALKLVKAGEVFYKGAGTYGLSIKAEDYKKAEKALTGCVDKVVEFMEKNHGTASFQRVEK